MLSVLGFLGLLCRLSHFLFGSGTLFARKLGLDFLFFGLGFLLSVTIGYLVGGSFCGSFLCLINFHLVFIALFLSVGLSQVGSLGGGVELVPLLRHNLCEV